ncbi:helix-turn-helix domain-containing protein [Nitrosospira sp. Nsp11]|uniref:transcriptional regulator n=1 Tax=Nitrosospira sp. Nsp11 TaxID=1855338 RepID=UPI000933FF2E|nr:helix-turn-helix domain-containing protein [Nitrosospira sp. Nsp11]
MNLDKYLSQDGCSAIKLAFDLSVPPPLISQWRSGKRQVPLERCPAIERATKGAVTCEELRPDFDWQYLRTPSQTTA